MPWPCNALLAQPDLANRIHVATPLLAFPSVAGHAARETSKTVLINGQEAEDQSLMRLELLGRAHARQAPPPGRQACQLGPFWVQA